MDKWQGKVACVTGSSSGIGANITKALADAGMTVIGLGRRIEPIQVCILRFRNQIDDFSLFIFPKCCCFSLSLSLFARNWPIKQQLAKLLQRNAM